MAEVMKSIRPGGETARRDLHFFWLLDGSGSMAGENGRKIASLNFAIAQAIPDMHELAQKAPRARLLVRVLRFGDGVDWLIKEPTPVSELKWDQEVQAKGETAMGRAIAAVVDKLDEIDTKQRLYPPAIVLVTDGKPTDAKGVFDDALRRLITHRVGKYSQRFAVAIGSDADKDLLKAFIGDDNIPVMEANDSDSLKRMIKLTTLTAIASASQMLSSSGVAAKLDAEQRSTDGTKKWD
jgi:uncharacterized protein YegL